MLQLLRAPGKGRVGQLRRITSKRFEITIEERGDGPEVSHMSSAVSNRNQMNSSIEFVYQSLRRPDKEYKLRLFRNGML